jgi:hypothetical protein
LSAVLCWQGLAVEAGREGPGPGMWLAAAGRWWPMRRAAAHYGGCAGGGEHGEQAGALAGAERVAPVTGPSRNPVVNARVPARCSGPRWLSAGERSG